MDVSGCEEMALSVMATGADRAIQAELKVAYGSSKMVKEIRGRGFPAGKERVERLMRPICKPSLSGATEGMGMVCVMSRKGNCRDNAPSERFFNSFKNERGHATRYGTRAEAEADQFDYIVPFYNRKRHHSTLGFASPVAFLENWISAQHEKIGGIMPMGWKTRN